MGNIVKGILALPLVVAGICAVVFVWNVVMMVFSLLAVIVVVAVPYLLKLAALAFIIFGTLWILGSAVRTGGTLGKHE